MRSQLFKAEPRLSSRNFEQIWREIGKSADSKESSRSEDYDASQTAIQVRKTKLLGISRL